MALSARALRSSVRSVVSKSSSATFSTVSADGSTNLKEVLSKKIPAHNAKIKEFRTQHNSTIVQNVTIDMIYGGMRSMKGMVTETSVLDHEEGIRFRGYSIPECQKLLPKAEGGEQPIPEAIWWLLCTGDIPTKAQADAITKDWNARAALPAHVLRLLDVLPESLHPMKQFVAAVAALNSESKFADAYTRGVPKVSYWEYAYEDSMNLLAQLPSVAAIIYSNLFRNGSVVGVVDSNKDWSANFCNLLGFNDPIFSELMRLYLVIHADHEGGNVSAHACHLVGSALSDPYLSYSAAIAGLAGPLHGLANQETLVFLSKIVADLGHGYTEDQLGDWVRKHLHSGQVVPGYGHAVLRKTDARYECQRQFALKHLPNDDLFRLVSTLYKITPNILLEQGKAKNPWPNVDAHSGVLLTHFGLTEMNYYTVLFGVSRALGCLSQLIWARGMGLPLERPKSHSTEGLIKLAAAATKKA